MASQEMQTGLGDKMVEKKDMSSSLLMETTKSQLTAEQPLIKKTLEHNKKDTLHPKKPQRGDRTDAITIKSNHKHTG